MLESLIQGFQYIFSWGSLAAILLGLSSGILVGALPGLTATMAVAVLSPFTFFIEANLGIPFLIGVYKGAIYGGSIPAIMVNTPGTAAAAATSLDGNVLARQGQARRALEISLYASVIGDFLATIVLIFVAAPLTELALKFSSPEFTMLFLLSLTMIAAVSGESFAKGLLSAALGMLIACIGLDPMSGSQRLTFGITNLLGGISLVPLLLGLFALSEVLIQSEQPPRRYTSTTRRAEEQGVSFTDLKKTMPTIVQSSALGVFLGSLPGLGAEISCWMAYGLAKRRSKTPEKFGQGSLEGLAAAESGNNAVCPAALIPMLVFGIPGDTVTAVLLGAFLAQGLTPGPLIITQHREIIYGIFSLLLVGNFLLLFLGYGAITYLRNISRLPPGLLYPAVTATCFAGAFAVNSSFFDLVVAAIGGFAGYLMRKTAIPIPPLIIALLLAPGLENAIRQSLLFSNNSFTIFVTRPISAALFALLVVIILFLIRNAVRSRLN